MGHNDFSASILVVTKHRAPAWPRWSGDGDTAQESSSLHLVLLLLHQLLAHMTRHLTHC